MTKRELEKIKETMAALMENDRQRAFDILYRMLPEPKNGKELRKQARELADKINNGGERVVKVGRKHAYCCKNNGSFHQGKYPAVPGEATFLWKRTLEDFIGYESIEG